MLNEKGQEVPDPTPIVVRFKSRVITEFDRVREFIQRELSESAGRAGAETFEEANDFDVEDDMFPVSPHEYAEDTERADREVLEAGDPRRRPPPQDASGKPVASTGGASSAPPVQGGAAPPSNEAGSSGS